MYEEDKLIQILGKYDSIVDFELDVKAAAIILRPIERIDISGNPYKATQWIDCPAVCKLTIYINEAWYVADRLFNLPIEEELETINTRNFVVKYTIKFIEPLEEEALKPIRWRKNHA